LPNARRRGFNAERELARILWENGFAVVRGPASGARARHIVYPDLVALYHGKIFVFEIKYRHATTIYITLEQVRKLLEFASRAGAEPYIAVKIPRRGWYIVSFKNAKETPKGIKIDEEVLERSTPLQQFINKVVNKPLDTFTDMDGERS
jgi:Holliday junction resolvase